MITLLEVGKLKPMATFRDRFNYLKTEKNVTLEEIASAINTNRSSMSRVANGTLQLKQDTIEALAKYFDVDQAYLTGESDVKKRVNKIPIEYIEVVQSAMHQKVTAKQIKKFLEALNLDE